MMNIQDASTRGSISRSEQAIKDEIMRVFYNRLSNSRNCASIVICKSMLTFAPLGYDIRKYIGCDIRMYLDSNMKNNIEKAGFEYSEFSSDEFQLVFIW